MGETSKELVPAVTAEQRALFIQGLEQGKTALAAARYAKIHHTHTETLLDLLRDSAVVAAVNLSVHKEICSTGKQLAWRVAKELLESKRTPPATRWAAARWTMEAAGEAIGAVRSKHRKDKDLHEMSEAELVRVVEQQRALLEGKIIDVTPVQDEYDGLFA